MCTLVFVHGLGDDNTTWSRLSKQPQLASFQHDFFEVPGFGNRPWEGEHIDDVAAQLRDVIESMITPVVLIGHSLGGAIGTRVAETPPGNLVGFVNIEGNLSSDDCGISLAASQATNFPRWFAAFTKRMPERYARALRRCDPDAFRTLAADLVDESKSIRQRYLALTLPKLVIYGTNGYVSSTQEWLKLGIVASVRTDGASHWVHGDEPEITAKAIATFVGELQLAAHT